MLSAITLDASGGGVAVVARLLWRVIEEQWGGRARLLTLSDGSRTPSFFDKTRYALALAALQSRGATDWVLFSHLGLAKPLAGIPKPCQTPYAVFLHGIEVWKPLTAGEHAVLERAALRLSNSRFTADRVMEMHPGIGPVAACPLGLPPAPRASTEHAGERFAFGPHAVLTVGRMLQSERYKGHDELIDAWPEVVAAVPDARLVIAGTGDDLPRLKAKAASRAGAAIVFTGFVSDAVLAGLYDAAALFALPSRGEGFGLVYLEAMSHRLACVGSTYDAAGEVIADGTTGCLVDQDRRGALAGTLIRLLVDEDRRRALGQAGYDRARTEFSFERFSARLCHLLGVAAADAVPVPAGAGRRP
jgi:phosphatidylinositol alpha-1,6-mannosyltransferase